MRKLQAIFILVGGLSFIFASSLIAQMNITGSVVKIYTVYNKHSYYRPWQMMGQESTSGSGCIINGNRILTNAHVVADSTYIQVKRAGLAKKYTAEVEMVAHECDLAILKVKDISFFSGSVPLEVGDLPEVGDTVATYGFPGGGEELAFTEGVVSRVELHNYTHSEAKLLSCQIDAAINPGSSGGPVIKDNKIVGVSFQAAGGENIGYMVSVPVINHFLKDIKDRKYDGIPGLGFSWQKIENPDMRIFHKMNEEHSGILVNKVYPDSPAKGILRERDIILSVEGENIANDGTVKLRINERTFFEYVIQKKYIGETVEFEVLRDGKVVKVKMKLSIPVNHCRLVSHGQYDIAPTYYIVAGLVFQKLTEDYLDARLNNDEYYSEQFFSLFPYYDVGELTEDRREVVVLDSVLADEINLGYHDLKDIVIYSVNGKRIASIADLSRAIKNNKGKYHVFVDERGKQVVLDKVKTDKRNKLILERYKVHSDRSDDLKGL